MLLRVLGNLNIIFKTSLYIEQLLLILTFFFRKLSSESDYFTVITVIELWLCSSYCESPPHLEAALSTLSMN